VKIALCISHTPWVPSRFESMARLRTGLGITDEERRLGSIENAPFGLIPYREMTDRASNWVWSESMWQWGVDQDVDYCLFGQDDLLVAPNFWRVLDAMLIAMPDEVIALDTCHPSARTAARKGTRWVTTADGLVGLMYCWPRKLLQDDFMPWRRTGVRHPGVEGMSEDTLQGIWALSRGRRIFHPVPTILDTDADIASTYGNDRHLYPRPSVNWKDGDVCGWSAEDLERPDFWNPSSVVHLGRFYKQAHWWARQYVRGFTEEQLAAAEADRLPEEYARFFAYP
jgi:hypothetical protein